LLIRPQGNGERWKSEQNATYVVEPVNVLSVKGRATADSASIAQAPVNARSVREAAGEKPGTTDEAAAASASRHRDNIEDCSII
jgi:hypothetical protein